MLISSTESIRSFRLLHLHIGSCDLKRCGQGVPTHHERAAAPVRSVLCTRWHRVFL